MWGVCVYLYIMSVSAKGGFVYNIPLVARGEVRDLHSNLKGKEAGNSPLRIFMNQDYKAASDGILWASVMQIIDKATSYFLGYLRLATIDKHDSPLVGFSPSDHEC